MVHRTNGTIKSKALSREFRRLLSERDISLDQLREKLLPYLQKLDPTQERQALLKARSAMYVKLTAPEISWPAFIEGLTILGIEHFELRTLPLRAQPPATSTKKVSPDEHKGVDGLSAPNLLRM